jgi:hypothetical protein
MTLSDAREKILSIEPELGDHPFVEIETFERNGRRLHLGVTDRLRRIGRRGRVWCSKKFLTAIKNAEYGFDSDQRRSIGGRDGIDLLDRGFRPANEMMRKIFDRYLDRLDSGAADIAMALGTTIEQLRAVRLVSHHMRLLGVLARIDSDDWLVLVDYDDTK